MISTKTQICCVIGNPVSHSLSPAMHNAAYAALHLPFQFVAFRVFDVKNAIAGIRALGIRAVAVTIPHKVEVMKYVDEIDEIAKKIGAVNTITNEKGILKARNTDWVGALSALEEKINLKGKKIAVIGAGGAARAIVYGLKERAAIVFVFNRTREKAEFLKKEFHLSGGFSLTENEKIRDVDIIINTTSLGMKPYEKLSPVPKDYIGKNQVVFDIVYTPYETKLLQYAREKGATRIYGYKMILYGGSRIFELTTGKKAPIKIMEKILLQNLLKPE